MEVDTLPSYEHNSPSRPRFHLSQSQRASLQTTMNKDSELLGLVQLYGENSISKWGTMIAIILSNLTYALAGMNVGLSPITREDAREIVKRLDATEFEEWKAGVQNCMQSGNWDDLIAHPTLQQKFNQRGPFDQKSCEEKATRLNNMFLSEYHGDAVKSLIRGIEIYSQIYDSNQHYGRSIVILQSSGTGKSRLVRELGNEVPTISICFRKSTDPNAGWPPVDKPAYDFFENHHGVRYKGEELAAAFIGGLAGVIAEKLALRIASGSPKKDWMQDWVLDNVTEVDRSSRFQCFKEVFIKAADLLKENDDHIQNARLLVPSPKALGGPVMGDVKPEPARARATAAPDYHDSLYQLLCRPNVKRLSEVLHGGKCDKFVIAFDECTHLNFGLIKRNQSWDMSLIALQRIIKAGDTYSDHDVTIWYLLLDTNSSIFGNLAPVGPDSCSYRLTDKLKPLPFWHYLGFNQMVGASHASSIHTAADALSLQHLKVYGRPYWSGLRNGEVVAAATKKLFLTDFNPADVNHVFAAFAVRICLEIGEGEASECLARDSVRSHMRILRGVIGPFVTTFSPSEPMLAIAAADALTSTPATYQDAITTLVDRLILRGLVLDRGMPGELCTRLLFTLCRDKAIHPFVQMCTGNPAGHKIQAVSLSQFLLTLLGDKLGLRDDALRQKFLFEISEIWINFTHFIQLSRSINELSPAFLLEAWSSGIAVQCASSQPVIDGFFVCYAGKLDEPFNIKNLIVVPWLTTSRSQAASKALVSQLTAPPIVETDYDGKPVRRKTHPVVIFMDIAASAQIHGHVNLTYDAATPPIKQKGRWDGYAREDEQEPERYCLQIRGNRSTPYRVLQDFHTQLGPLFLRSLNCAESEFSEFPDAMDEDMERVSYENGELRSV